MHINMENFKISGASKEEREAQHEQCLGIEKQVLEMTDNMDFEV